MEAHGKQESMHKSFMENQEKQTKDSCIHKACNSIVFCTNRD